jgi:hypothetical protein
VSHGQARQFATGAPEHCYGSRAAVATMLASRPVYLRQLLTCADAKPWAKSGRASARSQISSLNLECPYLKGVAPSVGAGIWNGFDVERGSCPGSLAVSAQEQSRQQVSRSTLLIWMGPAARLLPTLRIFKEAPEMTRGPVSPPSANCSWPQLWNCGACGARMSTNAKTNRDVSGSAVRQPMKTGPVATLRPLSGDSGECGSLQDCRQKCGTLV